MQPSDENTSAFSVFFDDNTTSPELDFDRVFIWLEEITRRENKKALSCQYIITTDRKLHEINLAYLNHDDYTDIITFPYGYDPIETEIYVSLERVLENANDLNTDPIYELLRVMVHGLLHMIGYDDKSETLKREMRLKEDEYLALAEQMVHQE